VASIRYVLATLLGSLFFLGGVALIYAEYGTLDMVLIGAKAAPNVGSATALVLMTMGLALKSALFPLHFWLPAAHASARAPVSAILSALVCEAPFYLVMRVWTLALPGVAPTAFAELVAAMAIAGIVWGSAQAARQRGLKMLVAYSTVAQIGYLFLFVPLSMRQGGEVAFSAAAYYLAAHACAKAAMFLAAGTFASALGSDAIVDLRGASVRLPVTTFSFALAGVTLVGLPPTGGFVAKWLLLEASIEAAHWPVVVAIMLGSLLTAVYVFVPVARTLHGSHVESPPRIPVPRAMQISTFALAIAGVLLGVLSHAPIQLLEVERLIPAILGLGGAA
jgi:multicomponent Na+:H+ antiporter subunit D